MNDEAADDHRFMGLALALGHRQLGVTWPNPAVGAVLVHPASGRIVAQGATQPGGRPHAERVAIAAAGKAARGATLYVSLEPCSHHGRTAPCADAIVAAGISRVVSAIADPDPRVGGRGHAILRAAGVSVTENVRRDEAARDHQGHFMRTRLGRPHLTVKLARTADGFAGRDGDRLMITGERANALTHLGRARADAILTGIGTARADDPRLDVRLPGLEGRMPVRVVLDSNAFLSPHSFLARTAGTQPVWLLCGEGADPERLRALSDRGVVIEAVRLAGERRLDLPAALAELGRRGLTQVVGETGPRLSGALAAADLVDELVLLTSERRLDAPGLLALEPALRDAMAARMTLASSEQVGSDLVEAYERSAPCSPVS